MKKNLWTLMLALAALPVAAAEQELVKGVDLSGITSPSATTLNQLVDRAYPAPGRGMIYVGTSAPDTTNYSRFTNYVWFDISSLPGTLRTYATGTWVSATIGVGSITSAELAADSVISGKIAANAIWTTNLNDNVISSAKIIAGAVTTTKFAAGSVTTDVLSNDCVTASKIVDGTIVTADIGASQITGPLIAAGSISNSHLAASLQIYNTNLAQNSVTTSNIQVNAIQTTNIAAGVIARTNLSFNLSTNNTTATIGWPGPGNTATLAHGLSGTPQIVRVVVRNTSTDAGWASGDEVDVFTITDSSGANEPVFATYADATNVYIVHTTSTAPPRILNKSSGARANMATNNWVLKAYCVYYP